MLGGSEKRVEEWTTTGEELEKTKDLVECEGVVRCIKLSPDEKSLLVVGEFNQALIYDFETAQTRSVGIQQDCAILSCQWDHQGTKFAISAQNGTVTVFEHSPAATTAIKTLKVASEVLSEHISNSVDFDLQGNLYLPGSNKPQIAFKSIGYELADNSRFFSEEKNLNFVRLAGNDDYLIYSTEDQNLVIIDSDSGEELVRYSTEGLVAEIMWVKEEDSLFVCDNEANLYGIWSLKQTIEDQKAGKAAGSNSNSDQNHPQSEANEDHISAQSSVRAAPEDQREAELEIKKVAQKETKRRKIITEDLKTYEAEEDDEASRVDPIKQAEFQAQLDLMVENNQRDQKPKIDMKDHQMKVLEYTLREQHDKEDKELKRQAQEPPAITKRPKRSNKNIIDEGEEDTVIRELKQQELLAEEIKQQQEANIIDFNKRSLPQTSYYSEFPNMRTKIQKPFNVNETHLLGSSNYLTWNMHGSVVSRTNAEGSFLDIEYSLGELSKKTLINTNHLTMASINYSGTLLAYGGYRLKEDEYEDDEMSDELKKAKVVFYDSKGTNDWSVSLQNKENINCIALGAQYSAVATSKNYIRFYAPGGMEFFVLGAEGVLCLAVYENILAILFNYTMPFSGRQCLRVKMFDTVTYSHIMNTSVSLSPKSRVLWFGFSQEGNLFIQDSNYTLWALLSENVWSPVFESKNPTWVIGISSQKLFSVKLGYGELEPNPLARLQPREYNLGLLLQGGHSADYCKVANKAIQEKQLKFRKKVWGHMSGCSVSTGNHFDHQRAQMPDFKQEQKHSKALDTEKLNLVRIAVNQKKFDLASWIAMQIHSRKMFELCCQLLSKMGKQKLVNRIRSEYQKVGAAHFLQNGRTASAGVLNLHQVKFFRFFQSFQIFLFFDCFLGWYEDRAALHKEGQLQRGVYRV